MPAHTQAPEHAVAAVERLTALGVVVVRHRVILPRYCCAPCPLRGRICVYDAALSTACITSRAIGAAAWPPY